MLLLVGTSLQAANITAPFEVEQSATLPKKVRNPRFRNVFIMMEDRFSDAGKVEPLAAKLNRPITFKEIINNQPDETQKNLVRGTLLANGISEDGIAGSTTGDVNTTVNVMLPTLAYGVNERLTMAVAVPVYKVSIRSGAGFARADDGQRFVDGAAASNTMKANEAADKLNNAVAMKLTKLDYQPLKDEDFTAIGDVRVAGKYRVYRDGKNTFALKPVLTLPTGHAPNADKVVDIPTGDGQYDFGSSVIWDRQLLSWLRFGAMGNYTVQFPDRIDRRLPTSSTDSLSADKELVGRDSGDQMAAGASLTYGSLTRGFSLGAGYNFQFMNKASFKGEKYPVERYQLLEAQNPLQSLHSATVMAGFGTIDWFKEKKFVYPFQAFLAYSHPFKGRNVVAADVYSAELVMFF